MSVEPVDHEDGVDWGNVVVAFAIRRAASVEKGGDSRSQAGGAADGRICGDRCRQAGVEVVDDEHRVDGRDMAIGIHVQGTEQRHGQDGRVVPRVGLVDGDIQ